MSLHHIPVPRYVHGPDGEIRYVKNHRELDLALREGFDLSPALTDDQKAAVRAAQMAAGEIVDDEPAIDAPKVEEKPKSKRSKSAE